MGESAAFAELIAGFRAGNPTSINALCQQYAPYLRAAVRRQLHPRLRTRFDSLDFVQDVWASFLAIPTERYTFDTPEALLAFLNRMAHNRVVEVFRQRFGTQKDDITREQGVSSEDGSDQIRAPVPTASQLVIADEEWDRLRGRFPAGQRMVLELLRDGHSHEDIARLAGVSLSTVNRIVRRLKDFTA
ncbi:helix-turn-helix domain-containing protein [Gemmata sp. G18]|uniref:Helix-turn-helix domain-containing protein n=1 Tax=Gemmata palustris TaxID=2822762 RepID=A0ABS5BKP7_9BACT|nr:RNA polymerase sigma factor [Gemmata palustris]MBP3954057.1 helix-turn-helix domain-containing protein [Gemmata palustris]